MEHATALVDDDATTARIEARWISALPGQVPWVRCYVFESQEALDGFLARAGAIVELVSVKAA